MKSEGIELANIVLQCVNEPNIKKGDGEYYPRVSAVSRCPRDMVMHRYGEPWSDPPEAQWGTQFRFDMGHDTEDRLIIAMEKASISVQCQQLTVEKETINGNKVTGHIDGIAVIPHEYPSGGKWYVFDVKSAGQWMYRKVFKDGEAKYEHKKQIAAYSQMIINDPKFPDLNGAKLQDLNVEGYEFGGGLVGYVAIDRPTNGRFGDNKEELPKIFFTTFEIDPEEAEMFLDIFDEVEDHYTNKTMPGFPHPKSDAVWGGIRCTQRWCSRFSVCQGLVEPQSSELKEVLNG
tara:strand:+ start:1294 stop:2160 length:867 start_codon:yes stop_codon:yes gene_type:complete